MAVRLFTVTKTIVIGFQCAASAPNSAPSCVSTVRPLKRLHSAPFSAHAGFLTPVRPLVLRQCAVQCASRREMEFAMYFGYVFWPSAPLQCAPCFGSERGHWPKK